MAAAAVVAHLAGCDINPQPVLTNPCCSAVDAQRVVHAASVHGYVAAQKTRKPVVGAAGLSTAPAALEGQHAWNWAGTIWRDAPAWSLRGPGAGLRRAATQPNRPPPPGAG